LTLIDFSDTNTLTVVSTSSTPSLSLKTITATYRKSKVNKQRRPPAPFFWRQLLVRIVFECCASVESGVSGGCGRGGCHASVYGNALPDSRRFYSSSFFSIHSIFRLTAFIHSDLDPFFKTRKRFCSQKAFTVYLKFKLSKLKTEY
jgi:hypothetical protein